MPVATQEIYPAIYFEDNFKATKKLTLNLGLRYECEGPWSERFNRTSFFDVNTTSPWLRPRDYPRKERSLWLPQISA